MTWPPVFRGDSAKKLNKLTKAAGLMREQLERMIDDPDALESAMVMMPASRFLHLEGRPLLEAMPKAVDHIDNYEWMEGEVVAGLVLGWNFGDGHLNGQQLVSAVQEQCGFEAGELRVVSVESQPLFGRTMAWKIIDAATGVLEEGETEIAPMRALPPWPIGEHAEAFLRGNPERELSRIWLTASGGPFRDHEPAALASRNSLMSSLYASSRSGSSFAMFSTSSGSLRWSRRICPFATL